MPSDYIDSDVRPSYEDALMAIANGRLAGEHPLDPQMLDIINDRIGNFDWDCRVVEGQPRTVEFFDGDYKFASVNIRDRSMAMFFKSR